MTTLDEMVEQYKREVAPPGAFDTTFPGATDDTVKGYLADGFAEAQLEGFFGTYVLDAHAGDITPDLSPAGMALVTIFAGIRTLRTQLTNLRSTRYKAGPVEYEVAVPASVLSEMLKDARARRDALLEMGRRASQGPTTYVLDFYAVRMAVGDSYFLAGELPVAVGGL